MTYTTSTSQSPNRAGRTAPGQSGHVGHGWMMIVCCIPMLVIAVVLVSTGVVSVGFLFVAIMCTAMMAMMMGAMGRGDRASRS